MSDINELKQLLNLELAKADSDNNIILELSHKIANMDTTNVRFSIDAGMIDRLGKELVGRHETAVAELIKNSYDADASSVELYFENCENLGGRLRIEDDGLGMTRDQLIQGFMRISSSDKVHNPFSERYKRSRAGQKGIGRFATQRIGNKLTIITQTLDSPSAIQVQIDWDKYLLDSNLIFIANSLMMRPKNKPEGTTLIIEGVRDVWTDAMINKAFVYVADLLQPFPLSRKIERSQADPGFKVSFYKNKVLIINDNTAFLQHALAEIKAEVDDEGQGFYTFKSDKLGIDDDEVFLIGRKERNDKFEVLRNVHLRAYYFIYNVGLIPRQVETYIRENAKENGGIRLYRNGFRVLPYGEKDDDWLGLDASVRRRSIVASHSNIHFYGFVEIVDKKGEFFQEKSSREGLLDSASLEELQDFGYKVLTDVAIKISQVRERKGTAGQKDWEKKFSAETLTDIRLEIKETINKIAAEVTDDPANVDVTSIIDKLTVIESAIGLAVQVQAEDDVKFVKQKNELLAEIQLLRILAGLGLTIGQFVHEINHYEPAFKYDAELLTSLAKNQEGVTAGIRLQNNLNAFTIYTSFFKSAISRNVNRELEPIELREPVQNFLEVIQPDLKRSNINIIDPVFEGLNLYTCPMHPSEWASILFNFYTNSKKAIAKTNAHGTIFINAGKIDDKVYLEFSDNGIGIPAGKEDQIFEAFYTTSSPSGRYATEIDELTGSGLGLKIVKDIIDGYGGSIQVITPKENFRTTIRIELPKTNI